jgi:hypothetical protein
MSETFECGDAGTLVAYVYGECEPDARAVIAAHVSRCASCSDEIAGLGLARRGLEAWTPPMPALGFRIPLTAQETRLPWWRAPLPAWAQVAAAVVIFGAGLSLGLARGSDRGEPAEARQVVAAPSADVASRGDLATLEQRLKSEMSQIRSAAPAAVRPVAAASSSDEEIMKKVEALLAQSEERQRREFTVRSVEMAREFETQRRVDLASVRETVGQFQGVAGTELRQQREAIDRINNYFIRVSQQGPAR